MSTAPWPVSNRRAHRDARDDHECPSPTVMVVDDDAEDRALFRRWLAGYGVVTAGSALEALTKQERCPAAVIMCDVRMPGHNGLWLAERLRDQYPDTAVIMITGAPDLDSAVMSLRNGVADYLSKPLSADHLRDSIRRGYAWHRDVTELRSAGKVSHAGAGVTIMPSNHASEAMHVESAAALNSMLSMLMIRDADAYEHARRVSAISVDLARSLQVGEPALLTLERAALLHDIGKTALPEAVLLKPCGLTADELALVHRHPQIGYELLCGLWPLLAGTAEIVRAAQERVDGTGFPFGIAGDAIPLGARIIAVADVYDTMTRPRVYGETRSPREATDEIVAASGTQYDAVVVDVFRTETLFVLH